jgi:hypothetical protein
VGKGSTARGLLWQLGYPRSFELGLQLQPVLVEVRRRRSGGGLIYEKVGRDGCIDDQQGRLARRLPA